MHYYFALFQPEESGGYSVFFPDFPGCQTCGDDLGEAMEMAMDALTGRIESDLDDGAALPAPSSHDEALARGLAYASELELPRTGRELCLLVPADPKLEPFTRLSVSMQPRLLAKIDRKARALGMTRSGFLAAAAQDYISRN